MTYSSTRASSVTGIDRKLEHAIDVLSADLLGRPFVSMVSDAYDDLGPYIVVGLRRRSLPDPGYFQGFRVMFERADVIPHGFGSFWSDPIGTLVSAPGKLVDAAGGGPQQRRRAHAASAAAAATQKKIDEEKASRDAAVAAATAAAQQDVAATTAAAKAASKKKLIKTLAIGGGAFAVLAVALFLVTGKSEPKKDVA